jgi:hypothetical protein
VALLHENKDPKRAVMGNLMRVIIKEQFYRVLLGPSGYWWRAEMRDRDMSAFQSEIVDTTLAKVISANTGVQLSGSAFHVGGDAPALGYYNKRFKKKKRNKKGGGACRLCTLASCCGKASPDGKAWPPQQVQAQIDAHQFRVLAPG